MATKLKADFEDMKLKLQLDRSDADIRTKQVRQQNERYIISQRKLLDEGSTIEQNDVAVRMEVALGRLLKQALHDQRAAFAEKMKQERAVLNQSLSKVLEEIDANIKKERANVDSMIKQVGEQMDKELENERSKLKSMIQSLIEQEDGRSLIQEEEVHANMNVEVTTVHYFVAPGFKNKTRYAPDVSPGSQISHIATNKGNIKRQCSIYNVLNIKDITLDNK